MANLEKLDELLGVIEANPDKHHQGSFACKSECGTTMCAAGWAVELWGSGINWVNISPAYSLSKGEVFVANIAKSGQTIADESANILELDEDELHHLFYNCQSLEDLKKSVKRLANGEALYEGNKLFDA